MDHIHGRFWPHHAAQSSHYCGPHLSIYFELENLTLRHTVLTVIGKFGGAVHENFLVICISDKKRQSTNIFVTVIGLTKMKMTVFEYSLYGLCLIHIKVVSRHFVIFIRHLVSSV